MKITKPGLVALGVYILIFVGVGSCNFGGYIQKKGSLVNKAIKGETINLGIDEPIYRTLIDKTRELLTGVSGYRLAEKRFKTGKFDDIIKKYRLDYHNNS